MTFAKLADLCSKVRAYALYIKDDVQIRMNILTYFDIKEKGRNLFHYEGHDEFFFGDVLVIIDPDVESNKLFIERRQ